MKKIFLMVCLVGLLFTSCETGDFYQDRIVAESELPNGDFMRFINEHFPGVKVLYIDRDYDDLGITYDFHLEYGYEVEFDKKAKWLDVDCGYHAVPEAIIPTPILDYVKQNLPGVSGAQYDSIVSISREYRNYEVETQSGRDLEFDKNGKFLRYDD